MKKTAKIAVASPKIKLCNPAYNANICANLAALADKEGADIIVFPELALTGATAEDLFFQELLISEAKDALSLYARMTAELGITSFVGLPVEADGFLYNSVAAIFRGEVKGFSASGSVSRHFASALGINKTVSVGDRDVALGHNMIFTCDGVDAEILVKVGDDAAFSPGGAALIINPVSTAEYVGLKKQRREYINSLSLALGASVVLAGAGDGESGTDGIYAGARMISRCGETVAEAELFDESILYGEVDLSTVDAGESHFEEKDLPISHPFLAEDEAELRENCSLAVELQSRALALRMERAYADAAVIGVSGGLDSTLAVLVAARAMDILGRERNKVIAITMPCFGTTERTKSNALALAELLGCSVRTIDIKASVSRHFEDIGHREDNYDVVYENAQARERTQILMDIANATRGLVVGTGDLSELALGFATYNGDHMSMYAVNASVPKTLMREIIKNEARIYKDGGEEELSRVLLDVVNTPISPELLPTDDGENKQHTESIVGPYELHDFFLYYTVKYGYSPAKVYELAKSVFEQYESREIKQYLNIFVKRFFSQQFKRSCLPDGPRVTEITLSPRGSWSMPSDVSAEIWCKNLLGADDE